MIEEYRARRCPVCTNRADKNHCKSLQCLWVVCYKHPEVFAVYISKNNHFVVRKGTNSEL